ncbi:MAG: PTS glucose transporter subunit IIA [Lachnospiraceae bacterium]|nr:PTS glucose transporter subunit IIA [Lachnospiraceae bacterium]
MENKQTEMNHTKIDHTKTNGTEDLRYPVGCPIKGEVIPLAQVPDTSLAYGMLGPGVGILPEEGLAVAPFDGEVSALFDTNHAIGLTSDDGGVEVLIHIGINTVALKGQYMTSLVSAGDHVKAGQPLIRFDMEKIQEAGYDTTAAVVVSNLYLFPDIQVMGYGKKEKLDELLECGQQEAAEA